MKGLGPKAQATLAELGVTRFDQIAAWSDADVARIDAGMGAFKGRIVRDRWVEQARYLAADDVTGFEAVFGKLGG
jgi:predicted flap endonuclease-1-like 5' DNA nuclease